MALALIVTISVAGIPAGFTLVGIQQLEWGRVGDQHTLLSSSLLGNGIFGRRFHPDLAILAGFHREQWHFVFLKFSPSFQALKFSFLTPK